MNFYRILTTALLACIPVFASQSMAQPATSRPNIIFMISDDHRWDCIGAAGNPNVSTPYIDQLASEGMYFRQGTIHIPTCSPSRATLLTGIPPHEHRWYSNELQWEPLIMPNGFDIYTLLPEVLQNAGYHTAFTGKWHQRSEPWLCGFQTVGRWMIGGAGPYLNPTLANGPSRTRTTVSGYTQTIFANEAISILQTHAASQPTQPLFLWLSFTAPHGSFQPLPANIEGMYDGKTASQLAPPTFGGNPNDTLFNAQNWPDYYEAITHLDTEVGRVMSTVRNTPTLANNTVVVFLGDNGFMMGEHKLHAKYVPYDGAIRVPFIVWGPDEIVGATGTSNAMVSSLDLPPTFAKIADTAIPAQWRGRDMTPVLQDGQPHNFTWAVSEYPDYITNLSGVEGYRTIRTNTHKLIWYYPQTDQPVKYQNALYDLVNDPHEITNLYNSPAAAQHKATLEQMLTSWRTATNDTTWTMQEPLKDFEQGPANIDEWMLYQD